MSPRLPFPVVAVALALVPLAGCSRGTPEPPSAAPAPVDLEAELRRLEEARTGGERAGRPRGAETSTEVPEGTLAVGARLIDAGFRPLADGSLTWCEADPTGLPLERARASADSNGALWLTLPRAAFVGDGPLLLAEAPGHARRLLGTGPGLAGEATFNLGEVQLGPAGELAGRVRAQDGRPLADARVWLGQLAPSGENEEPELARFYPDLEPLDGWLVARSDAQGNFRLPHVPPGTFDVLALPAPGEARLVPAQARATVAAGTVAELGELVLATPRSEELVRGLVRGASGEARAHARLVLVPADGRALARVFGALAGADGRFELLVPAQSTWVLEARDVDGLLVPTRSEVVRGGDELELVLGD